MTAPVWTRDEVESPCVNVCVIHPETRLCTGCGRSIDEITAWSRMSQDARREVMTALPHRVAAPQLRRGGRAGRLGPKS
jgi:hypothetical protein